MEPRRVLIVANQTAAGAHLKQLVRERMSEGPCRFTLVVPATPPGDHTWTEGEVHALAEERLADALEALRETGADIDGVVGDTRPLYAVGDALLEHAHDEIVVSTLPPGASRWLKQDLPHRIERQYGLPVTHIVAEPAAKP
jgi:GABA permease